MAQEPECDALSLLVASYSRAAAVSDRKRLEDAARIARRSVEGLAVLSRSRDGRVDMADAAGPWTPAEGGPTGGTALAVGLFAPQLLLHAAIEAGAGDLVVDLIRHQDVGHLGVDVGAWLPPGASALLAVLEDAWVDEAADELLRADRTTSVALSGRHVARARLAVSLACTHAAGD
jgi:hypothetical protein